MVTRRGHRLRAVHTHTLVRAAKRQARQNNREERLMGKHCPPRMSQGRLRFFFLVFVGSCRSLCTRRSCVAGSQRCSENAAEGVLAAVTDVQEAVLVLVLEVDVAHQRA
eukprot:Transcript_23850.p1 GENE.Transcript_23850~~Transcript_23850.p1  ORF type:complete len:109 (-),score=2.42 Transcript_23850:17-343(-)